MSLENIIQPQYCIIFYRFYKDFLGAKYIFSKFINECLLYIVKFNRYDYKVFKGINS